MKLAATHRELRATVEALQAVNAKHRETLGMEPAADRLAPMKRSNGTMRVFQSTKELEEHVADLELENDELAAKVASIGTKPAAAKPATDAEIKQRVQAFIKGTAPATAKPATAAKPAADSEAVMKEFNKLLCAGKREEAGKLYRENAQVLRGQYLKHRPGKFSKQKTATA